MKRQRPKALALLAVLLLAVPAAAIEIGPTNTNGQIWYLAEASNGAAYYAQLFVAPGASRNAKHSWPLDLTFTVTRTWGSPSRLRVLIAEVAGDLTYPSSGGAVTFVLTNVVWESPEFVPTGPSVMSFDLTGLRLVAGQTYAFVIDAFEGFDGSSNYAEFSGGPSDYNDGYFFFLGNPPGSNRLENFGRTWVTFYPPGVDLDFRMNFRPRRKE